MNAPASDIDGTDGSRLTRGMMIAWGVGTLGPVVVLSATNALLLRFMTDIYGLGAGLAASLIAFSKLYDAFADMAMGVVSDRTRSRWGRRRPYLITGGVLLAVSIVALFAPPAFASETARIVYMGAILVFYATAYTIFNIPYMAMPGEMTRTYHERTELMLWRVYGVGLSIIIATFLGPILLDRFGNGPDAYMKMALVFTPIVIGAAIITFAGTARAPMTERAATHYTLKEQIALAAGNKPFLALMAVKFTTLMALGLQAIYPFFFQRILAASNSVLGTFFLVQSLAMLAAPWVWLKISRRIGKKRTFVTALALSLPVWLSWLLAQQGEPLVALYLRAIIIGFCSGGIILMGQSMLPDTMDYDYRRTGLRREGVFAALYTTVEKLSGAIGVALVGAILGAYGYIQSRGAVVEQPESALHAIRYMMAFVPIATNSLGILALLAYHLDERDLNATARTA